MFDDDKNPGTRKFWDSVFRLNLKQHVSHPTPQNGHTLDLSISKYSDDIIPNVQTTNSGIAGHYSVVTNLKIKKPKPVRKTISYLKNRSIDLNQFENNIKIVGYLNESDIGIKDCDT